jgi:hypothetical protein
MAGIAQLGLDILTRPFQVECKPRDKHRGGIRKDRDQESLPGSPRIEPGVIEPGIDLEFPQLGRRAGARVILHRVFPGENRRPVGHTLAGGKLDVGDQGNRCLGNQDLESHAYVFIRPGFQYERLYSGREPEPACTLYDRTRITCGRTPALLHAIARFGVRCEAKILEADRLAG